MKGRGGKCQSPLFLLLLLLLSAHINNGILPSFSTSFFTQNLLMRMLGTSLCSAINSRGVRFIHSIHLISAVAGEEAGTEAGERQTSISLSFFIFIAFDSLCANAKGRGRRGKKRTRLSSSRLELLIINPSKEIRASLLECRASNRREEKERRGDKFSSGMIVDGTSMCL